MSDTEQIIKIAKAKKVFRTNDLRHIKNSRHFLSKLEKAGELVKLKRGLYSLPEAFASEHQTLLETARAVPNGVVCLLSALRFHELTTQNPFEVWIAIERKSRIQKIDSLPLRTMFFSGAAFTAGVETHAIEGVALRIYNPPKTVADCFKYRNKIGLDVALEALRDAWNQKKATMDELWHYAKICRMTNVMRPYLESLV